MTNLIKKLLAPFGAVLDFIQKYFKALLFLLILFLLFSSSGEVLKEPNLMKLELKGAIESEEQFMERLKEAEKQNIKGVLLVVDSPGGAVAPSIEISLAVKKLKEKKPVIAYAAGTMASGSYYASIWADKIIANPGSVIGSIGVLFQGANIKELLDKIGVKEQSIAAGKYKQIGTMLREWKPYERAELEKIIKDTYDMFVSDVARARGLDINRSSEFAEAHIFTARMAKKVGLIDEVASMYDAKKELEKLSKVKNPIWREEDKFEKLMNRIAQEGASLVFRYFFGLKAY